MFSAFPFNVFIGQLPVIIKICHVCFKAFCLAGKKKGLSHLSPGRLWCGDQGGNAQGYGMVTFAEISCGYECHLILMFVCYVMWLCMGRVGGWTYKPWVFFFSDVELWVCSLPINIFQGTWRVQCSMCSDVEFETEDLWFTHLWHWHLLVGYLKLTADIH